MRRFRDHPALLAWYLNDELPQTFLPRLEAHQRVAEEDPNHPTWVVLYQYREVAAYLDVRRDRHGPLPDRPEPGLAGGRVDGRDAGGSTPRDRCGRCRRSTTGSITQRRTRPARTTAAHRSMKRSMAWQCLCEGATGLVFYSWYDLKRNPDVTFDEQWGAAKRIVAEIDRFAPALLAAAGPAAGWRSQAASRGPRLRPSTLACPRAPRQVYIFAVNDGDGARKWRSDGPASRGPAEGDAGRPLPHV